MAPTAHRGLPVVHELVHSVVPEVLHEEEERELSEEEVVSDLLEGQSL